MNQDSTTKTDNRLHRPMLFIIALLSLIVHLIVNAKGGYGIFRDELYYIACSRHLDWGYVDQPPFCALLLAINRAVLGDSLVALRFLPALAGAGLVFLSGLLARELGGGRFAQAIAATAAFITPVYLAIFNFYSMNAFDLFFAALCFYILVRIIRTDNRKLWIPFGLILGVGVLNKLSILFLCGGLVIGLLLTGNRRHLASRWFWLGGLIALLIFSPYLLWQIWNDWPTLEFMRNVTLYKNVPYTPIDYFGAQFLQVHPFNALVWIPGLLYLQFVPNGSRFRFFAIAYLFLFALFVVRGGKPYYLAPMYSVLFAAGGVVLERFLAKRRWTWARVVLLFLLVSGGLFTSPMTLPYLPVDTYVRYVDAIGIEPPSEERDQPNKLGQHYSDMFGWKEMAESIAGVYRDLPPEDQAKCAILTQNYGQAGAVDFFGEALGLPKAISGHNNYWIWGPREYTGEVMIIVGGDLEDHVDDFASCQEATVHTHPWARSFETNLSIWVCRGLKWPLEEIWPEIRFYI